MLENILLAITANFLTDFIKKLLGIVPTNISPEIGQLQPKAIPSAPQSIQVRRAYNQERRDIAMAALSMVLNMIMLLGAATLLPLLLKSTNGLIQFSDTRTPFPYVIELFPFALALVVIFSLPSFYIVQKLTQHLVTYIHNEWSDVSRWRAVRFFIGCCFIWLPIYAGALCYWLFPKLTLGESFGYPIGGVAAMFAYAWSSRRQS